MRILLIRTSALGDVVHCLPVLSALRRHLPEARVGWVVEEAMAPLLDGHPDLEELLVVRLRSWRHSPFSPRTLGEIRRFLGRLRRFAPDVVIDLMGNHKGGILAFLAPADRRLGAGRTDRREPSSAIWINEPVTLRGKHVTERALSLLEPLGVPNQSLDFGGDKLFLDAVPPSGLPERFFAIHPGAGWPNKRYPAGLWGEAAVALRDRTDLPGVVVHGPGEADLARSAAAASRGALAYVPTSGLAELGALLRGAELVMGGDTGPIHLAHALGTRVLCLMGPTDPETYGPPGERPGELEQESQSSLWKQLPCSFCHTRLDEPKACLTTLPARLVAERAEALLGL